MTTPVCVRQRIRQLDRQGLSHKEISRRLGVSRTTVVKYADRSDYSPKSSDGARGQVVPEKLRTLDHGRPWSDDQFASTRLSSNRDMSR